MGEKSKKVMLGTAAVAAILKVEPTALRRWLRANGKDASEGRYEWEKGSPALARLIEQYKKDHSGEKASAKKADTKKSTSKGKKKAAKKSKSAPAEDDNSGDESEEL